MNKLISKIVGACLGLSLATGVGVGVAVGQNNMLEAKADDTTYNFNSSIPTKNWTTKGGSQTINGISWTYSSSTYIGANASRIQIGSKNDPQTSAWTISTPVSSFGTNITITGISITAYTTATTATYSIAVNNSTKKNGNLTTSSANYATSALSETSGNIVITLTGSSNSKALYLNDIAVTYSTSSAKTVSSITAELTNSSKVWKKGETVAATDVTVHVVYSDNSTEDITNGLGVTITNGTLNAGNNTVTVGFGGKTATISIYGKAPSSITSTPTNGSSISLNSNGADYVEADVSYQVNYNNSDVDYRATFSCSTSGWTKTSDLNGVATLRFESNATFIFTLAAADDNNISVSFTFVVSGIPTIEYAPFEDDIEEGDYVFIDKTVTYVMGNTINNNRIQNGTLPTIRNGNVISPASAYVWHISKTGSYWTIQNSGNSKYLAANNSNSQATLLDDINDNAKWIINYDSTDGFTFENYGRSGNDSKYLRNNSSYGWACYQSGTGNAPTLYKLADSRPLIRMVCDDIFLELGQPGISLVVTNESTGDAITGFTVTVEDETIVSYSNGVVSALAEGETTLIVSKEATDTYRYSTISVNVTVFSYTPLSYFYGDSSPISTTASGPYTFKGTVIGIESNTYYLQEGEYGICIYGGTTTPPANMKIGDLVRVTAKVVNYRSRLIETSGSLEASIIGNGLLPATPVVTTVADFANRNQSTLVTFKGLSAPDNFNWTSNWVQGSTNGIATVEDADGTTITLFVSKYLESSVGSAIVSKINSLETGDTFDLKDGIKAIDTSTGNSQLSILSPDNIDILRANEDPIQHWIDSYLFMDDPSFAGQGTGLCETNHYYVNAKANLIPLGTTNVEKFRTNEGNAYTSALARYTAWASACGDSTPFAGQGIVPASRAFFNIDSNSAAIPAIVVVIALATISAGAYFFLRKKKEN